MNNYSEGERFEKLLEKAEIGDIDMSSHDWCQACGYLEDYGHGYIFNLPESDEEIIAKIEAVAEAMLEG